MCGGRIMFVEHYFPQLKEPPCDDPRLIKWLEENPGFGKVFWLHHDSEVSAPEINPESIPEDSVATTSDLQAAAETMQRMGIHVNPALLAEAASEIGETPEETEGEPVVNTLPTLTFVARANKEALQGIVEKHQWNDINSEGTANYLRDMVRQKVKEAQQTQ
jgi:hypothetical protein